MSRLFIGEHSVSLLGCIASEERCSSVPLALTRLGADLVDAILLRIVDPPDGFPDYSERVSVKTDENRETLNRAKLRYSELEAELLASEDHILELIEAFFEQKRGDIVVLDTSSLPKRFFCLILKQILKDARCPNVAVAYTQAGYPSGHLAEDPMTCDYLPGFCAPLTRRDKALAVSAGFEVLNIKAILEMNRDAGRETRILMSFPPDGEFARRQWKFIRHIAREGRLVQRSSIAVAPGWDVELAFLRLQTWQKTSPQMSLAPFGTKPHSIAMALLAIKHDLGMYYTQPKVYKPDYSQGVGDSWAYVVKWGNVPCFDRTPEYV